MNLHVSMIDQHLGIDHDSQADEMRLLLAKALTALQQSRPVNGRAAELRRVARREITAKLGRAA